MENFEIYMGARNTQNQEQIAKNYAFGEICTAPAPVVWIEKDRKNYRSFPIRSQDGSGQCVVMTLATEMGIIFKEKYGEWIDFSSSFPYQQRKYPTISGCTSEDIYSVFPKIGDVFEKDMPSQDINDAGAMAIIKKKYFDDLAKVYKINRIALPLEFETIASVVQATGKGVMIWVHFHPSEWTNIPTVSNNIPTSGHSITVVDFTLKDGKKYLVIQDSWGLKYADQGLRLISEEYFYARCYQAGYLMAFNVQDNSIVPERPHFILNSVSKAKDCLKWEGIFPSNVPSNDVADNIFRSALVKYQTRYGIYPTLGNFGPLTNASLAKNYE